jgi:hypothetical protein
MKESPRPELGVPVGKQTLKGPGRRVARKHALLGVGIFFLGFLLGGFGSVVVGLAPLVPFADALVLLGFVLSIYGLVLGSGSLQEIAIVGIIYGLGEFYKGQDHGTHIASGIGFGLVHEAHIFMGLLIIDASGQRVRASRSRKSSMLAWGTAM